LTGRFFEQRDTEDAPPVAIVNEPLVQKFFPGVNPFMSDRRAPI
jgi:hypothetical protein